MKPRDIKDLLQVVSICLLEDKFDKNVTPRSLIENTGVMAHINTINRIMSTGER